MSYKEKKKFQEDGYILLKDFLPREEVEADSQEILEMLSEFLAQNNAKSSLRASYQNLDDLTLHEDIINFRKIEPKKFGKFYDTIQNTTLVQNSISKNNQITKMAANLVGCKSNIITSTGWMMRFDTPYDDRNALSWHTDSAYYPQTIGSGTGLVVIKAISNYNFAGGCVGLIPGSHLGRYSSEMSLASGLVSAQQMVNISEEFAIKAVYPELSNRDVLMMDMNLLHCSGQNISTRVRLSFGLRYHNSAHPSFRCGRLQYRINDYD